ncbi:MAG: hypothetical protein H6828_05200 [Planctomycetes bacterium]|nr:hypothetical protein [Planctomycetota bacterium]
MTACTDSSSIAHTSGKWIGVSRQVVAYTAYIGSSRFAPAARPANQPSSSFMPVGSKAPVKCQPPSLQTSTHE